MSRFSKEARVAMLREQRPTIEDVAILLRMGFLNLGGLSQNEQDNSWKGSSERNKHVWLKSAEDFQNGTSRYSNSRYVNGERYTMQQLWDARYQIQKADVFNQAFYDRDIALAIDSAQNAVFAATSTFGKDFNVIGGSTISAPKEKESNMSIKVTTPTLINGRGEDSFSTEDLISLISGSVNEVARLNALGFESKVVKALIAREEAGQKATLAILDARSID